MIADGAHDLIGTENAARDLHLAPEEAPEEAAVAPHQRRQQ
jgi:hypothetical protein